MNELNSQNYSEALQLLIDGELNPARETELYSALLEDEGLREELRESLAIRESIRNDAEAFAPPAQATRNVFAGLGYSAPQATKQAANAGAGSKGSFLATLKSKLWNPLSSAIIASAITALLFIGFYEPEQVGDAQFVKQTSQAQKAASAQSVEKAEKQTDAKQTSDRASAVVNTKRPAQIHTVASKSLEDEGKVLAAREDALFDGKEVAAEPKRNKDIATNASLLTPVKPTSQQYLTLSQLIADAKDDNIIKRYGFASTQSGGRSLLLYVRGLSAQSFPNVNVNPDAQSPLANISIGAFVPISENAYFGLEAGQEAFGQVFYNIENEKMLRYKQNPLLIWGGFGFKYAFDTRAEFLANAQPFAHLTLASTKLGPFAKGVIGARFVSENGLGVSLGIEGSSLLYQNANDFYWSHKLGLVYGLFMKF